MPWYGYVIVGFLALVAINSALVWWLIIRSARVDRQPRPVLSRPTPTWTYTRRWK
jgi:hypothetical protein